MNSTTGGKFYNGTTSASFVMDADLGVPVLECKKVITALRQFRVQGSGSRFQGSASSVSAFLLE